MGHTSPSILRQVIENTSMPPAEESQPVGAAPSGVPSPFAQPLPAAKEGVAALAPQAPGARPAGPAPFASVGPSSGEEWIKQPVGRAGHMKMLFDNAPVAMAMFDKEMKYILANRRWLEDFKLQAADITGRSQYELFPSLHPGWRHVYDRALNGQVVRSDRDAITQEGRPIIYRWEVRPWRNVDTTIGGVMITCSKLYANADASAAGSMEKPAPVGSAMSEFWQCDLPVLAVDKTGVILRSSKGATGLFLSTGVEEGATKLWEALGERADTGILQEEVLTLLKEVLTGDKTQGVLRVRDGKDAGNLVFPGQWEMSRARGAAFGVDGEVVLAIGVSVTGENPPFTAEALAGILAPSAPMMPPVDAEEVARLAAELKRVSDSEQVSLVREARLRAVLDLAPCGLLVLDERARPIYHNSQVQVLLGRGIAEGQSMEEWIAEGSRDEAHREEVTRQWREGVWRKQLTVALTLTSADELLKDIEMRPVSLPGGGLMVMMQDVTDSRRSEEMLRSTEAKFRTLVHENPQPVILTDRTGSVFDANPAAEALLGYTRAELRRMGIDHWLEGESISTRALALREMAVHSERARVVPVTVLNREGNHVSANLRLAIVPDVQGEPMFTVQFIMPAAAVVPIVEGEADHVPEPLMDDLPDEVSIVTQTAAQDLLKTDAHGKILEWSEAASEHFGYTGMQMHGRGLHSLFRPSDATGFYAEVSALAVHGDTAAVEWIYYHGEEGKMEGSFVLKFTGDGGLSLTLQRLFSIKVPAEVQVPVREEAPIKAEDYLLPDVPEVRPAASFAKPTQDELSREKVLLGETHHRVKNHLQIITSMLNLQISTLHNEEARDALRSSQNRVRSIAALHQHLYQISIGESGEFATFARSLIGHLRECFEVNEERVRLDLSLPEKNVPEEWLMPLALSLNEMVSNAFKHAYANGREGAMQVTLEWDDQQGLLCVTDDGGGLPSNFEDLHPGGMGLKILRVFAGQLGGEVQVNAVPTGGAEFRLIFPVETN